VLNEQQPILEKQYSAINLNTLFVPTSNLFIAPYHKLIEDIKATFNDEKVVHMLSNIITNPIDTPFGFKNPSRGIALRGPLSQLFSALYLEPLDCAFDAMNVTYVRYQDDYLILCKTKRQLNRCRRRMMTVLAERKLTLSRKKSRIGSIDAEFHFLGVHYPGTQPQDSTNTPTVTDKPQTNRPGQTLIMRGGGGSTVFSSSEPSVNVMPHPRTLRKARMQVLQMVADGFSDRLIRRYLHRWCMWWSAAVDDWTYDKLLRHFLVVNRNLSVAEIALTLRLQNHTKIKVKVAVDHSRRH
jgi:RNA-directed DNA polymerase